MVSQSSPTLSISHLSKAVDEAVKIASERHKVQFAPEFRVGPGLIMGRELLQANIQVQQLQQIATDIAQHVGSAAGGVEASRAIGGQHLEAACLCVPRIICGFVAAPNTVLQE
jgi:hypothetical protein